MGDEGLLELLGRAQARTRNYADYWEWEIDRKRAERGVAETLIEFLGVEGHFDTSERETPDLAFVTRDGRKIGIEVTEVVDEHASAHNRSAERKHKSWVWAVWKEEKLVEVVRQRVASKDAKLAPNANEFDEVWLALATDEPTIDMAMAERACATCGASAQHLRRAFMLLGYHPDALSRFPSGCAVFPVALR